MKIFGITLVIMLSLALPAMAEQPLAVSPRLQACLQATAESADAASQLIASWLQAEGENDAIRYCQAVAAFKAKNYGEAAQLFATLANAGPRGLARAELLSKAGWALARAGDQQAAVDMLTNAIGAAPEAVQYWLDRAQILLAGQFFWEAQADLAEANKLLQAAPNQAQQLDWHLASAEMWLGLGNAARATQEVQVALMIAPNHPQAQDLWRRLQP